MLEGAVCVCGYYCLSVLCLFMKEERRKEGGRGKKGGIERGRNREGVDRERDR